MVSRLDDDGALSVVLENGATLYWLVVLVGKGDDLVLTANQHNPVLSTWRDRHWRLSHTNKFAMQCVRVCVLSGSSRCDVVHWVTTEWEEADKRNNQEEKISERKQNKTISDTQGPSVCQARQGTMRTHGRAGFAIGSSTPSKHLG